MALLSKIGKSIARGSSTKTAMGLLTAGAVVKGLSDSVGGSAINNAMDIAFDNPEADRTILGTDLTPSLLLGQSGIPGISGIAKGMNASQYGINVGPMAPVGGAMGGGALGFSAGFKMGGGFRGAIAGGILGSTVGGSIGAAPTVNYMKKNQRLLTESPFSNTSLMTADMLNASGDIVFGMHNSRRG